MAAALANDRIDLMLQQERVIMDASFKLVTGWMVFLFHTGWSMLETGSIRYESIPGVLNKNMLALCVGFLVWWVVGYSFAFGPADNAVLGSMDYAFDASRVNWYFQGTFCATAVTIPSGAVAERMNVKFYAVYAGIIAGIIYPAVSHWCWSGQGFLSSTDGASARVSVFGSPFLDFAGAAVVHMTGGIGALLGAIAVGPRKDRFTCPERFEAHNLPMVVLATLLMWFSWFGFNTGSLPSLHGPGAIATALDVVANTTLAPAVCALILWSLHTDLNLAKVGQGYDASTAVVKFCNGVLAGCVSITGPCGVVDNWAAVVIGMLGALIYHTSSKALVRWQIDDPLDAFAVHGACGLWSVIATGLFARTNGVFYGGGSAQLVVQLAGALVIISWGLLTHGLVFLVMKRFPSFIHEDVLDAVQDAEAPETGRIPRSRTVLTQDSASSEPLEISTASGVQDENQRVSISSGSSPCKLPLPCIYEDEQSRQQQHDLLVERVQDLARLIGMSYNDQEELVSTVQEDLYDRLCALEQFHKELTVYRNGTVTWRKRQDSSSAGSSQVSQSPQNSPLRAFDPPPIPESLQRKGKNQQTSNADEISVKV